MSIYAGRDVPKDRRTDAETSPKSDDCLSATAPPRLWFDRFTLDLERACLVASGKEVPLRPKTFDFLRYLATNPSRLVSKDELLTAVWSEVTVSDDSVVQCVTELRRALSDQDQRIIRTVRGRGYRFEARISAERSCASKEADGSGNARDAEPYAVARARSRRFVVLGAAYLLPLLAVGSFAAWWRSDSVNNPSTTPPLSIAVLPFVNLSDDPIQEYFSDGVTQDLTTELSRIPGILVIAHASARTYRGKVIDARQVGREINVRYLVEGSVRKTGDHIRLNARLVNAETGATAWAELFDRRYDQLAAWQDEVIGRIAIALNYRLTDLESQRGLRERRDNPAVFDLVTRGWALVYAAKRPENYFSACALFQQALERDAGAVSALAGIAWTSAVIVLDNWSRGPIEDDLAVAEAAVTKTLAIDPNDVIAHHVRGFLYRLQGRPHAARDAFRTTIAINPNFAPGHAQIGATEIDLGRPEGAIPSLERAMRLSPRDPSLGAWLALRGMAELHLGRYQQAASWLTRAIDTGTPIARHNAYLASALAHVGRLPEARAALAEFRKMKPSDTVTKLRVRSRSKERDFVVQQERFFEGLRLVGLPE